MAQPALRVLVTGARGFIGSHIVAALLQRGHRVRAVSRAAQATSADGSIETTALDLACATSADDWNAVLQDVDVVVNCAGILREVGRDRFAVIHEAMPTALATACADAGIQRLLQISALGDPADGAFIASKHRGDATVQRLVPTAVILRPSLVYSTRGSYGGSSLLRALAALPLVPLAGGGRQRVQPLSADDLADLVCRAVEAAPDASAAGVFEVGGPQIVGLVDYLAAIRRWLGLGALRGIAIPSWLGAIGARLGELSGRGPLGMTMWRMLNRGNVLDSDALARLQQRFNFAPRSLDRVLAEQPSSSADRWHARLYLLAPLLRATLALTWVASGVVGLLLPEATIDSLSHDVGLDSGPGRLVALFGSVADVVLGVWLLLARRPRWPLLLMAGFVVGYTVSIGWLLPSVWMDPFGAMIKNAVILCAIAIAAATADRS